jgi:hypothetical protein
MKTTEQLVSDLVIAAIAESQARRGTQTQNFDEARKLQQATDEASVALERHVVECALKSFARSSLGNPVPLSPLDALPNQPRPV